MWNLFVIKQYNEYQTFTQLFTYKISKTLVKYYQG